MFLAKNARNRGHVKYVKVFALLGPIWPQTFNTFNILKISLVSSTFRQKDLTLPLFREGRVTKQGKC